VLLLEAYSRSSCEIVRARPAYKVKAPFVLTRMRDWRGRGRRYAWLWSRRGKEWVIEQELYLGRYLAPAHAEVAPEFVVTTDQQDLELAPQVMTSRV
jgi:hypothetical protein